MDYVFFVKIFADGKQIPSMEFFQDIYRPLNGLASGYLNETKGVIGELENIGKILSKEQSSYSFADNDWCIVDVGIDFCIISNGFGEFEPINIPTQEMYDLLEKWYEFLRIYENEQIPNLKYSYNKTM